MRGAFTLVEIVITLGIVSFCIIPMVGVLVIALNQSRIAQEQTEVALIAQSMEAILGGMKFDDLISSLSTPTGSPTYNFGEGGRSLSTSAANGASFYRCSYQKSAGPASSDQVSVTLLIEYPAPGYGKQMSFPKSFFRYGSQY